MGWTEEQTLSTRIPAILSAYKGRRGMLREIFGGEEKPKETGVSMKDPAAVKAFFAGMKARQG